MKALAWIGAAVLPSVAFGQASLLGLGDLPGGNELSEAYALTPSGAVAAGGSIVAGSGFNQIYDAFTFAPDAGLTPSLLGPSGSAKAYGLTPDGTVVVGSVDYGSFSPLGTQAFVWYSTGPVLIGDLAGGVSVVPRSVARGVSADGRWVVGIGESDAGTEAWRYDVTSGQFEGLGDLAGGQFGSYAYGVSADGSVIVGQSYATSEQQAMKWTAAGGMVGLGFLPTGTGTVRASSAEAASADGSVIVGWSRSVAAGLNGQEACVWGPDGAVGLGDLAGGAVFSAAYAVSPDGRTVVGRASIAGACGPFGCGSEGRAFVWTAAEGLRNVQELLESRGVNVTGWRLQEARGVSADGQVIVGNGINPAGLLEGWMAVLGPRVTPCDPDYNADGNVDQDDVRYLVDVIGGGENPTGRDADFNGDGNADQDDYAALVNVVAGGACP